MQRTPVIGGWRPLPYLKLLHLFGQGKLTLVREKSGKGQGILKTDVCGNHVQVEVVILLVSSCCVPCDGLASHPGGSTNTPKTLLHAGYPVID